MKFKIFLSFYNICKFCKKWSSCRGPLNPLYHRFSLTRRNLQFFADVTILKILAVFEKSQFSSGPSQAFLLQIITDSTYFVMFRRFYNISNFHSFCVNRSSCRALPISSSTGFHWLHKIYNFSHILQYIRKFRKNRSSCRGPLNPFFYRFSLTRQDLQYFSNFTIFAIFAVFAEIAVLLGALSSSFSTGFHGLYEIYNFS